MSSEQWMAVSSLFISLAVLIFGAIQYRAVAKKDYVEELSARIIDCEKRREALEVKLIDSERERDRLTRLTMDLVADLRRSSDELIAEKSSRPPPQST